MKNTPAIRKEQFSGCLIGQCAGDALGFPVEGYPPEVCGPYVKEILRKEPAELKGRGPFPFGQYTDDSQLARELLQSYVANKHFSPEDYSLRIAAIFSEERIVGRGRATEEAANRLIQGISWKNSGALPPSAGNGSAMRAGPIGLLFFDDTEKLIQAATDQGRITHQDKRCSAGAVAIAGAVGLSLILKKINVSEFLIQLSQWTLSLDHSMSQALKQLIDWISLPLEEAVNIISHAGLSSGWSNAWPGISPFVIPSVLWSLYSFLKAPDDYLETIRAAIACGGDVDTTAAMAGSISGAYLGLEAIPIQLTHYLTDQGTWGYNELLELANETYDIKMHKPQKTKRIMP